jgi:hypothetical protein
MKLDPGMHISMHLVFFRKTGVTKIEATLMRKASRGICNRRSEVENLHLGADPGLLRQMVR